MERYYGSSDCVQNGCPSFRNEFEVLRLQGKLDGFCIVKLGLGCGQVTLLGVRRSRRLLLKALGVHFKEDFVF
jgi:hypothetical protein